MGCSTIARRPLQSSPPRANEVNAASRPLPSSASLPVFLTTLRGRARALGAWPIRPPRMQPSWPVFNGGNRPPSSSLSTVGKRPPPPAPPPPGPHSPADLKGGIPSVMECRALLCPSLCPFTKPAIGMFHESLHVLDHRCGLAWPETIHLLSMIKRNFEEDFIMLLNRGLCERSTRRQRKRTF